MKRDPALKYRSLLNGIAAVLLGVAGLVPVASGNDPVVRTAGGITYVSGGIGAESIDQLSALTRNFNLKLVFALKSGDYLSGVNVTIADTAGKTMLNTTSDGPWFLVKLPAGRYQVVATFAGTAVTRQIAVGAANLGVVDMRWASE